MMRRALVCIAIGIACATPLAATAADDACANLPAPNTPAGKAFFSRAGAAAWGTISSAVPKNATAGTNFYVDVNEYVIGKGPSKLLVTLISPKGPIKASESVDVSKGYIATHTGTKVFLVAEPGTTFVPESPVVIDGQGCGYSVVGNTATTQVVAKLKGIGNEITVTAENSHPSKVLKALAAVAALGAAAAVAIMLLRARRAA